MSNLNPQQFPADPREHLGLGDHEWVHQSTPQNRRSIAEQGLLVSKSNAFSGVPGVYVSRSVRPEHLNNEHTDLWAVDTRDLPTQRDPIGYHDPAGNNRVTPSDVSPDRIRLVKAATRTAYWDAERREKVFMDVPPEGL